MLVTKTLVRTTPLREAPASCQAISLFLTASETLESVSRAHPIRLDSCHPLIKEGWGFKKVGVFSANGRTFGKYWDVAWFERSFACLKANETKTKIEQPVFIRRLFL